MRYVLVLCKVLEECCVLLKECLVKMAASPLKICAGSYDYDSVCQYYFL